MELSPQKLFQRVAGKFSWDKPGVLDRAGEELRKSLKSRRPAVATPSALGGDPLRKPLLSDSNSESSDKENQHGKGNTHLNLDSSDDEFDQILARKATPRPACKSVSSAREAKEPILVSSSDNDDTFENFLSRVKTPKAKLSLQSGSGSDDGLKHFIVDDSSDDDFVVEKKKPSISKGKLKTPKTPKSLQRLEKQPVSQYNSPVFLSESDDDSDIVIKSTWKTRHSRPASQSTSRPSSEERDISHKEPRSTSYVPSPLASVPTPVPSSAPPMHTGWRDNSASSEDEFQSLLDRIRKTQKLGSSSTHASPKPPTEPKAATACVTPSVRGPKESDRAPVKGSQVDRTPAQLPVSRPVSQTEARAGLSSRVAVCKTPGCFLQSLSVPDSAYCRSFKQNKEELTKKLYQLYNTSVFESKLPTDMSVTWNTKMRKTAGYCVTGQERVTGKRYARIELSVKVCDSADRLRDTLVHEMCHAATWLINNVRDGHGPFWKIYARKATLAHPELPMVTRCHSYDINYKYQYQCNRCKNTIGRHSKSLDTQKYVCALCTGQLVLLTPSKSRGPTPFATYVKENYGTVRQELTGQSHAEVMRKLSADFASKTRLSQS
ncbi:acidic repeat-containing protein [Colossoma macropomum]|uniref:acidic repeat-containing protein n=1 Tax=Colossoma macropomum TaxID=42526 RepID=UPI0018643016|nr:acidic repeat-containing protein [Colossoma macropomum]